MSARYRKKPIEVRAARFLASDKGREAIALLRDVRAEYAVDEMDQGGSGDYLRLWVVTIDGNNVEVPDGAYVVIDSKGSPYPCDAEIFDAGHERI